MTRMVKRLTGWVCALCLACGANASASETYQATSGNVAFDADLEIYSLVTDFAYSSVICQAGKPNLDACLTLVQTRDPGIIVSEEERVAHNGETYSFFNLTGELGSGYFSENAGSFQYATTLGDQIDTMISYYGESGADETFYSSDLAFMTVDEVTRLIDTQSSILMEGIDFDAYLTCYQVLPLSADVLNQINAAASPIMDELEAMGKQLSRKAQWTEVDECYYIVLREKVQGVPLYQNEFWPINGVGYNVSPPWLEMIVSANGLEYIGISGLWEPTSIVERGFAMSLEEACDNYVAFHSGLLGEQPFTVDRITFAYVPLFMENELFTEMVEYRPAFIFHRNDGRLEEAFDAVTKELLSWME